MKLRWLWLALAAATLAGCPGCTRLIGNPCSASLPCGAGTANDSYVCDATQPGGYCTRPCAAEGVATGCGFSAEQADGLCARFANDGGLQCAESCTADAGCRDGYRCAAIGAGRGCVP